jgi:transposase InsO family protein
MDRRLQFIAEFQTESYTMTELAAAYGISRRIGYYWVDLYERFGPGRLAGASRRPHSCPHATPADIVDRLLAARTAHPSWGAGKLRDWLRRREPTVDWPCRDTIHEVFRQHGRVRQRLRRRAAVHPPIHLTTPTAANQLWTTDYKGEFRTRDGRWCYPFTLRDAASRYVLRCTALASHTREVTQAEFVQAFRTFGLPDRIRSDNGAPFGGPGLGRLSRLAVWWLRLGIYPERITPRHPEQNGSHEQFHRILKRDATRPPAASRRSQQRRFSAFVAEYNQERPHEALGGAPPSSCYTPSPRVYPERLPPLEYPAGWEVRRVSTPGSIHWRGHRVFLTEVLAGHDVAFEPIDDGLSLLRFASLPLARFDERRRRLLPLAPPLATPGAGPAEHRESGPGSGD